jgi:single CXXC unit
MRRRVDSVVAEAAFRARLAELGAELLEPYRNRHSPVRVRCAAGHECIPRPANVQQGYGICRTCAGKDPAAAETAFRARLAELGAELLEPYRNSLSPHRVRCAAGHECAPRPASVQQGDGICRACAGNDPAVAETAFRARLAELGAELLEPYRNSLSPHRVRCAAGHESATRPSHVLAGRGACRFCAGKVWDVFYVVAAPNRLKFGITSHGGKPRLATHRAAGFHAVVRLMTDLPGETASDIERAVLAALHLAGVGPVRGREYYDIDALALVLDIVDNFPVQAVGAVRAA